MLTACRRARRLPFGVLSLASDGLLVLAPAFVVIGRIKKPDSVLASLQGESLQAWIVCVLAWLAPLVLQLLGGIVVGRRHVLIGEHTVTIRGVFGAGKPIKARGVVDALTIFTFGALSTRMTLRYQDDCRPAASANAT